MSLSVISPRDYTIAVGALLKSVRINAGYPSVGAVERESTLRHRIDPRNRRFPAVVVASYERGDRRPNLERLAELAAFYRVPMSALLPGGGLVVAGVPASGAAEVAA